MSVIKLPTEPVILTNKEHSNRVVDLAQYDASGIIIGHGSKADTKYDNQNQKWIFEHYGSDYYFIRSAIETFKSYIYSANGLQPLSGLTGAFAPFAFKVEIQSNSAIKIKAADSDLCWTLERGTGAWQITLQPDNGADNQVWTF